VNSSKKLKKETKKEKYVVSCATPITPPELEAELSKVKN